MASEQVRLIQERKLNRLTKNNENRNEKNIKTKKTYNVIVFMLPRRCTEGSPVLYCNHLE